MHTKWYQLINFTLGSLLLLGSELYTKGNTSWKNIQFRYYDFLIKFFTVCIVGLTI